MRLFSSVVVCGVQLRHMSKGMPGKNLKGIVASYTLRFEAAQQRAITDETLASRSHTLPRLVKQIEDSTARVCLYFPHLQKPPR